MLVSAELQEWARAQAAAEVRHGPFEVGIHQPVCLAVVGHLVGHLLHGVQHVHFCNTYMYIYISTYIYIYICVPICVDVYMCDMHIQIHIHTYMYVCIYIYMCVCMHTHTRSSCIRHMEWISVVFAFLLGGLLRMRALFCGSLQDTCP